MYLIINSNNYKYTDITQGVFLSANPNPDLGSIRWILLQKRLIGFVIQRIQIQIYGLVIYAVPLTMHNGSKLIRWFSGISSWSINGRKTSENDGRYCSRSLKYPFTHHFSLKIAQITSKRENELHSIVSHKNKNLSSETLHNFQP